MILADSLIFSFTPLVLFACAVAMIVLRAGASRIFFDIVGTMQAEKLIKDSKANATIMEALYLDALAGIQEGFMELGAGFSAMMDDVMPIGKEIGEAARQFEKFVNTGEDIDELNAQVIQIGNAFGFSADQAFDASAKMAQLAGVLGPGSIGVGTEVGMAFGMISGMTTEAAMQRMINLNQQTGFMTENINENTTATLRNMQIRENSFRIMDQLNSIENTSVATMSQLTFVMNQFAAQANLAGESISNMASMAAVLIESGEEQGKAGRALRMVYARLGADTAGARKALEELNIAVVDAETGALRPLSDILVDLQPAYQGMTGEQKQNLAQTIAGNVHYTRLIKLLEGTSRMQELNTNALEAAFPAQEEINRLQETNLFTLEQMEAKLKNAKGALAEELMPAMKDSIQIQAVFIDSLAQLAGRGGFVGDATRGLFRMGEMMRTIIGPFAQQILSVMHLRIAMETLNHVKKAMNNEDMFHLSIGKARNQQTDESILKVESHRQSIERMIETMGREHGLVKGQITMHDRKAAALGMSTIMQEEHNIALQAGSAAINTFSMGLGVAGTGMMMFGDSQRAMRAGMVLNTFAMTIQILKLTLSTAATAANSLAMMNNTGVTIQAAAAAKAKAIADTLAATAANAFAAANRNVMLSLGVLGAALLAAGHLANFIAGSFDDVSEGIDGANQSFIDLAGTSELAKSKTLPELNTMIEDLTRSVQHLSTAEDDYSVSLRNSKQEELDKAKRARDVARLQTDNMKHVVSLIEEADKLSNKGEGLHFSSGMDFLMGRTTKTHSDRSRALRDIRNQFREEVELLEQFGIRSTDVLAEYNIHTLGNAASDVADFTSDISSSFTQAEDTMHSFNNAREELFFGFSSSNLTGDLIRQVQQQGVENLITNTEVIMTNNFNGMTVPEVADQILEEIESRANLSGISLSMSAA